MTQQGCPDVIRTYARRLRSKNKCDDVLNRYIEVTFPEEAVNKVSLSRSGVSTDSDDNYTYTMEEIDTTGCVVTTTPTHPRSRESVPRQRRAPQLHSRSRESAPRQRRAPHNQVNHPRAIVTRSARVCTVNSIMCVTQLLGLGLGQMYENPDRVFWW